MTRVTFNCVCFLYVIYIVQCKKFLVEVDDEKAKGGNAQENPPSLDDYNYEYNEETLGDEGKI